MKTKCVILTAIAILASGCASSGPIASARKVASEGTVQKNFRCDNLEAVQFIDADGKAGEIEVNKQKIVGAREESTEGDFKIVRTSAKMFQNAQATPLSNYTALRKTKTVKMPNDIVREISEIETQSISSTGEKRPATTSKTIQDFKLQKDGSQKLVRQFRDGMQLKIQGSYVRIFGLDGVEASFSSDHRESETPQDDGATFKTLQYSSVCTITPVQ